jgi:hypothetical protein
MDDNYQMTTNHNDLNWLTVQKSLLKGSRQGEEGLHLWRQTLKDTKLVMKETGECFKKSEQVHSNTQT